MQKQIKFYRMRHHYKSCKKYQDEYGVSSIIPNFQISQDSVGNSNRSETSASDNIETYQENTGSSGHPTLSVPCVKNQILPDSVYWIIVTVITYFR